MNSPLLSACGTSETCRTMLPSPPPLLPDETKWIVHVDKILKCMPSHGQLHWKNPSIYKVPAFIADLNCKAYQPEVVSFGPYHYGDVHLHQMEEHKHRVLLRFLERSGKTLKRFLCSLREVARDLEESYETLDLKWMEGGGGRFLELMIMDGCFMLEIMRTTMGETYGYAPNDPLFSSDRLKYIRPFIKRDMLILENQLPMLVLYKLVAVESDYKKDDEYVNMLVLKYCSPGTRIPRLGKCLQAVDIFRKGLLMKHEQENVGLEATKENEETIPLVRKEIIGSAIQEIEEIIRSAPKETEQIIRSATELKETGIQFKKSGTRSLEDITFANGVLRLPVIKVGDTTKSVYLNLMTFERLHIGAGNEITAYVTFMDNIINNERDVALLHAQGIIQNALGSDKAVAELFNSLCEGVPLASNSSLDAVQVNISKFCDDPSNSWWANFRHTYFRNPWTMISFVAAILLFALTIIQTVYTVLSYY